MSFIAIDSTGLSLSQIKDLRAQGVKYFGRYLSRSTWKGLSAPELAEIKGEGGEVFSIYESAPTHASYFSYAQGQADASTATDLARRLGQPAGKPIYFTVDYDAQPRDFAAILDYFKGVKSKIGEFKVGAYGSFAVMVELHKAGLVEFYFQTTAWSYGAKADFLHLYQSKENTRLAAVNVDIDEWYGDFGSWGQPAPAPAKPVEVAPKVEAAPVKVEAPKVVAAPPAPKKFNILITNLRGLFLGAVHEYICDKGWGYSASENKDGTISIEVGTWLEGQASYAEFKDYLDSEKFQYVVKEV